MLSQFDAREGYAFLRERLGAPGPVLLFVNEAGAVHITDEDGGYSVEVFASGRRPAAYWAEHITNARRVGVRALAIAAEGYEVDMRPRKRVKSKCVV